MTFRFSHPEALWLLVLLLPIIWSGLSRLHVLGRLRMVTAVSLRCVLLLLIVAALAGMELVRQDRRMTVVAVMDQSESVRRFASVAGEGGETATGDDVLPRMRRWLEQAAGERTEIDQLGVVVFGQHPAVAVAPSSRPGFEDWPAPEAGHGSDAAEAIRLGLAMFPPGSAKRLVFFSDGHTTSAEEFEAARGSARLLEAARDAASAGTPIDVVTIPYRVMREVVVDQFNAPPTARVGQTIELSVILRTTEPAAGELRLEADGVEVDLSPGAPGVAAAVSPQQWTLQESGGEAMLGRYLTRATLSAPIGSPGPVRFEVTFVPSDEQADSIPANNHLETICVGHGSGRVLLVSDLPTEAEPLLVDTLEQRGIEVTFVTPQAMPRGLDQLVQYDAVVFQNVPMESVPPRTQEYLLRYVQDFGGGFVMIGGPNSFAPGGWTHTPIDRMLPVTCELPTQTVVPAGALVLVLDRSGSMDQIQGSSQRTKQEVANESAVLAISTLYPRDYVGVVVFDTEPLWVTPLQRNTSPMVTADLIRRTLSSGGTNIYPALRQAGEALGQLEDPDVSVRHAILLTDGRTQTRESEGVVDIFTDSDVSLSVVGIGQDLDYDLLTGIADQADGRYYEVLDVRELPRIFIKEARTIRKTLVHEETFVPQLEDVASPITSGIEATPALHGLVRTGPRDDPRVITAMRGPEGAPLLAHWQVGLGRAAAFTSDATNRWAVDWVRWSGFADLWARMMRTIGRPAPSRRYEATASFEGSQLRVSIDLGAPQARLSPNPPRVAATLIRPEGTSQSLDVQATAPGRYEARAEATDVGSYVTSFHVESAGGREVLFAATTRPPNTELRRFRSDAAVLREVASLTGGRVLALDQAPPQTLFQRDELSASWSVQPIWQPLLIAMLVVFLLDVAARRLAWHPWDLLVWLRGRTRSRGADEESIRDTLGRLAAAVDGRPIRRDEAGDPAYLSQRPDPSRRFDSTPGEGAAFSIFKPSDQSPPTINPHPRDDDEEEQDHPPAESSRTDEGSHWLDAKRRAQRRFNNR